MKILHVHWLSFNMGLIKVLLTVLVFTIPSATSEDGTSPQGDISCEANADKLGGSGTITCHYPDDVRKTSKAVLVQVEHFTTSNALEDTVISCLWTSLDNCRNLKSGHSVNEPSGSDLVINIEEVTANHMGEYVCKVTFQDGHHLKSERCVLQVNGYSINGGSVAVVPSTAANVLADNDKNGDGSDDKSAAVPIAVGVACAILVVVVLAVVAVVCYRRRKKKTRRPDTSKKKDSLVDTLQNPTTLTVEGDGGKVPDAVTAPPRDGEEKGERDKEADDVLVEAAEPEFRDRENSKGGEEKADGFPKGGHQTRTHWKKAGGQGEAEPLLEKHDDDPLISYVDDDDSSSGHLTTPQQHAPGEQQHGTGVVGVTGPRDKAPPTAPGHVQKKKDEEEARRRRLLGPVDTKDRGGGKETNDSSTDTVPSEDGNTAMQSTQNRAGSSVLNHPLSDSYGRPEETEERTSEGVAAQGKPRFREPDAAVRNANRKAAHTARTSVTKDKADNGKGGKNLSPTYGAPHNSSKTVAPRAAGVDAGTRQIQSSPSLSDVMPARSDGTGLRLEEERKDAGKENTSSLQMESAVDPPDKKTETEI